MKIVARLKLSVNSTQKQQLLDTMADYNSASNSLSQVAWENNTYGQYDLHHLCYKSLRATYPHLKSNHIVRVIARVSQSYKLMNKVERITYAKFKAGESERWNRELRTFKWRNGMELDGRLWNFLRDDTLSIATIYGRIQDVAWACNEYNLSLMRHHTDSATLIYRRGNFYLHVPCEVHEHEEYQARDFIGVDMGVVNIATTSDGDNWNGDRIESKRQWYAWRKVQLQRVGTDSAKRKLQKLSGRESRFKRDVDHCISKDIVANAERTQRGIALEDLSNIRERVIRKAQRPKHHAWSFYRLRGYIEYKSKLFGVPVVLVNPAYTSQRCNVCGYIDKANRKSQGEFICRSCNHHAHADLNAALNIKDRAISTSLW